MWEGVGDQTELQHIDSHSSGHDSISFLFSCAAQSGAWGLSLSGFWFSLLHLISNDWTSCAPSYIIIQRPPSSCGRHKSHSFNQSTVKVIFWYSSTGCTCYLHRCISYFDSPAGSEVNIQQLYYQTLLGGVCSAQMSYLLRCSYSLVLDFSFFIYIFPFSASQNPSLNKNVEFVFKIKPRISRGNMSFDLTFSIRSACRSSYFSNLRWCAQSILTTKGIVNSSINFFLINYSFPYIYIQGSHKTSRNLWGREKEQSCYYYYSLRIPI